MCHVKGFFFFFAADFHSSTTSDDDVPCLLDGNIQQAGNIQQEYGSSEATFLEKQNRLT